MKKHTKLYLGVNAFGHDSAVFLVSPDTQEVAALATERVTRVKHDKFFFFPALEKLCENRGIMMNEVEHLFVGHSFTSDATRTFRRHEYRIQEAERKHFKVHYVQDLRDARASFKKLSALGKVSSLLSSPAGRYILAQKVLQRTGIAGTATLEEILRTELSRLFPNATIEIDFFDHQQCHATSSYFTSSFDEALLISYDGWGDGLFSRVYIASQDGLREISSSTCPYIPISTTEYPYQILGSPGGIYAYVTHLLGFTPLSDEGKVEALAAYDKPDEKLLSMFMSLFTLDTQTHTLRCEHERAEKELARPKMNSVLKALPREVVAASVQKFLEQISHQYVEHLVHATGVRNVCLSGGTSANVIMNLDIFETITDRIHITPAMADDGTAQGAAFLLLQKHGFSMRDLAWLKGERSPYFGTAYRAEDVLRAVAKYSSQVSARDLGKEWPVEAARRLTKGDVGAIFSGRMEWGPRALGNRSIVADPTRPEFRDKINKTIKRRPLFQPFCPSMLAEEAERLFEHCYLNKHMTCAFRMKKEFWNALPSAIHIDGTARVQFVEKQDNPEYHKLLTEVKRINGYGVVINTSFNKHGRTIVETPEDAIVDFLDTDMDYLIVEGILITRI